MTSQYGAEGHDADARLIALAATNLAIVWVTGPDGAVEVANPSWAAFTGQSFEQYRGRGWLAAVHPDDRSRVAAAWDEGVRGAATLTLEYRLQHSDGRWREIAAESAPVLRDGAIVEWIGFCVDVTDRRRAEAASRTSESHLRFLDRLGQATRSIVDATEVMQATAQLLGEHLRATRTAYADVEADNDRFHIRADWSLPGVPSSAGSYSLALFGPRAVANLHQGITLVVRDVDRELGEHGGAPMFNAIGIQAIVCAGLVKSGKLVAMMAVHQAEPRAWTDDEVTIIEEVVERCWAHIERVRDTAKLREQDRRKDEFLALLGHELRNPLAPLRYAAALLPRVSPGSDEARAAHARIDRQVTQLARLVDDLLDVSRINRGLIQLKTEPVLLVPLLEQAVDETRALVEGGRHTLQCRFDEGGPPLLVVADPARVVQMVGNLLHNAAKYTAPGSTIRLAARAEAGRVLIEVTDTGAGIPPEHLDSLFRMFTQLPHTTGQSQGGLGIGLALVKHLAELHGGDARAESAGLGQGSTFTIDMPLAQAVQTAAHDREPVEGPTVASKRVLVVEDNDDNRMALLSLLEVLGYQAEGAPDGPAGLEAAARFEPDVVLLDLGLPGLDGVEVGRRLRANPRLRGVGLVALTGWGSEADRRRTAEAGFDEHLTKPVDPDVLTRTLSRVPVVAGQDRGRLG